MSKSNYSCSTLSGLVESDSEDATFEALHAMSPPDSAAENMAPAKKGRERPKTASGKITKAKVLGRLRSGGKAAPANKGQRTPLIDRTNKQCATSDTEEVDEFEQQDVTIADAPSGDELDASVVAVKQRKPRPVKSKTGSKVDKAIKDMSADKDNTIIDDSPETPQVRSHVPAARTKQVQLKHQRPDQPKHSSEVIQETQASLMVVDEYGEEELGEPAPKPVARYANLSRLAPRSLQTSVPRRRPGSASDTERNDPAIRRKLGETTKKLENLDLKYRNVREIGIKEAEHNFERLKKQSEENKRAANELIASLKADLAAQETLVEESRDLKKTVKTQAADVSRLQAKVAQLTSSLSDAHIENKTLSAKLAANRTAAASVESANGRAPGSAVKANGGIRIMGSAEAAQAAQAAQLKEDLYGDLTGLIIRDVKREAEEDIYDCIQTGRNGTLHFKLAVANENSAESYDDAQCIYIPQLDPSRDKALMEILPEYLIDEITFPRPHSTKFYARVVKALTEK